jgi:hypothetical protein
LSTPFNLLALQYGWGTVENIDGLDSHLDQVAGAVEQTAKVASYFAHAILQWRTVGLADNAQKLVNRVKSVNGYGLAA